DQLLVKSAKKWPLNTALDDGSYSISYRDLDAASNEIAEAIHRHTGATPFKAAVFLSKSIESVIAIFAILKAGGTYVPLDYEAPVERNQFIVDDCGVSYVFSPAKEEHVFLTDFQEESEEIEIGGTLIRMSIKNRDSVTINTEDLAYILYTSGSTGQPKGVVFSHSNALSFIDWCSNVFDPDDNSVFSSHAPFHFDLSILDLYVSIKHGAKLILLDSSTGKNPRALSHLIQVKKITHWYSTPTILKLMINYGKIERHNHSSLRFVLFAGEVFPPGPLRQLTELWPQARFFNLYGPTETNVCTYYELPLPIPKDTDKPFPIGKTCEHLRSMLLHTSTGKSELCISGPAVCKGYWNNPKQNALSFFEEDHHRWYRTGDLVTLNDEGCLIYEGRKDRMVKKNGFRIELGEIENALHQHPGVVDAAVLGEFNDEYECKISAFIQIREGMDVNLSEFKVFCQSHLPHYMTPDYFQVVKRLPKTSTDKTDYQTLKKLSNEF
nr:amino acid adenylation domain-containing protein [Saprospiraceae bacterium]